MFGKSSTGNQRLKFDSCDSDKEQLFYPTNHKPHFKPLWGLFVRFTTITSSSLSSPPKLTCRGNLSHRCDKLQCFHSQSWNWKLGFNFLVTFNVDQLFLNCQTFSKCSQDDLAYKDIKAKLGDVGLILKLKIDITCTHPPHAHIMCPECIFCKRKA